MKRILIICAMFTLACTSNAQQAGTWDENTGRNVSLGQGDKFAATEMEVDGGVITFNHLPTLKEATEVVITDASGTEVIRKAITKVNKSIDIHNLRKSKIYYVTLLYNDQSRKAFVLRPDQEK